MKDMDKIFRSKLYNHESVLPDDLWGKIESGLAKKKKRGIIWFFFGGIGLLGILSATVLFSDFNALNNGDLTTDAITNSKLEDPEDISTSLTYGNDLNENIKEEDENIIDEKGVKQKIKTNVVSMPQTLLQQDHKEVLVPSSEIIEVKLPKQEVQHLKIDLANIAITIPSLDLDQERTFKDPVGCPTFKNRNRANLFIEAYYQPLFAYSRITSNSPEVGEQYIKLRKDSEQNLYSWSTGINIGWISDYNVGVKAGLEYEVINERFSYEDPEAIRNQTIIVIDTIFNSDGTFNISSDTSVVQVSGFEIQKIHNYHRTLSIPIHAIYHINFENLALELSGGPIFNIHYKNRGKIVDPTNDDQWFTNGQSGSYNVYKDRLSVGFSISASALYSINENIQLFARPTFKYTPGTMSVSSSPFNQTYMNTGLSLGARYYFSGNPNY